MSQYLIKYVDTNGKYQIVDGAVDIFELNGIIIGGTLYDETNLGTVSGIQNVSGDMYTLIQNVSGVLQSEIDDILSDQAKERHFLVTNPLGQQVFSTSGFFEFSNADIVPDVQVFKNGIKMRPNLGQVSSYDYTKLSTHQIQFLSPIPQNSYIYVRDERTGGGGGGGGGGDLQNITVNIQPIINGTKSIGTVAKAWSGVFLKDKVTSQVYELEVVNGVFQVTLRP